MFGIIRDGKDGFKRGRGGLIELPNNVNEYQRD